MARTIKVEDVQKLPRGRKPEIDETLVATLSGLKPGQAIVLDDEFGNVEEDDRSTVSQTIRKHWKAAYGEDGVKPSINFSPEGLAQVHIRKS